MTSPRELFLHYADVAALRADHVTNLRRGRAFVPAVSGVGEREPCELVLVHPETGAALRISAEIVYVKPDEPGAGVGVAWPPPTADAAERLRAFAEDAVAELEVVEDAPAELEVVEDAPAELEVVEDAPGELEVVEDAPGELEVVEDAPGELGTVDDAQGELEPIDDAAEGADGPRERAPAEPRAGGDASTLLHERIRRLTQAEQQRLARGGSLPERTMLERVFGPAVWESLLQNARLTHPEVARIAKKGTLPKPLVEQIAANAGWLGSPEVQRALLSNPRSSPAVVARVLRALPKGDLARVPQQTAYPMATRLAAKKLLKD